MPRSAILLDRLAVPVCLSLACVLARGTPAGPTPVWVRSHNGSAVDVYLMCGSHDARRLGTIPKHGSDAFEIPKERRLCAEGLNFFLVVLEFRRGYWVGPFQPRETDAVRLVIEKYAGLSTAELIADAR